MKTKKTKKDKIIVTSNKELTKPDWLLDDLDDCEGELSIDVFQDEKNLYIISTIAGVEPDDIEISLNNDLLTIRGFRHNGESIVDKEYFCQECYWGGFSRSVVLPVEVKTEEITADLKDGVLTIALPKLERKRNIEIKVKEN